MKDNNQFSPKRNKFNLKYVEYTEEELYKEHLFAQQLQIEKLEKIRSNTSILVWWLVVMPILFGIILYVINNNKV